jgi:small subunit ribosomal protein S18
MAKKEGGTIKKGSKKDRFMKKGVCVVDYKDVRLLTKLVTPQGKLYSRKRSGASAYSQNKIKTAVKRARFLGLLPYVGR